MNGTLTAGSIIKTTLFYLAVIAIVVISVFPFYYAIITSFKAGTELFRPTYWPESLTWANYLSVLSTILRFSFAAIDMTSTRSCTVSDLAIRRTTVGSSFLFMASAKAPSS